MYFISRNNKKEGPLSLEEVKRLKLTEDILVWKDGLSNWVSIKEVPELKDFVISTPPLLPVEVENEENKSFQNFRIVKSKRIILRNILIGTVVGILLAANQYYWAAHPEKDTSYYTRPVYLTQEERENPVLVFWHMLPYSLLIGQLIMLLVSGFQIYRLSPESKRDDDRTKNF